MEYKVRYKNELYHHGILGQKWGQKNGPPYPLDAEDHSAKEKKAGWKKSLSSSPKTYSENSLKGKIVSANVDALKESYPHLTEEELKASAERRYDIAKKMIIGAVAVAGVSAAAYGIHYVGQNYVDDILKEGTTIQNLHSEAGRINSGEAFYASFNNKDDDTYVALFGRKGTPMEQVLGTAGNKFKNTATVGEGGIKIASNKSAEKVFDDLYENNKEFKKAVDYGMNFQYKMAKELDIDPRKTNYEKFNTYNLIDSDSVKAQRIFYDALRSKGYGGVADVNDRKYSGFDTKAAIIFDRSNLTNHSSRELQDDEIGEATLKYWGRKAVGAVTSDPTNAVAVASATALVAVSRENARCQNIEYQRKRQAKKESKKNQH